MDFHSFNTLWLKCEMTVHHKQKVVTEGKWKIAKTLSMHVCHASFCWWPKYIAVLLAEEVTWGLLNFRMDAYKFYFCLHAVVRHSLMRYHVYQLQVLQLPQYFSLGMQRASEINQGQNSTRGVACEQGRQLNVSEETKYMPSILASSSGRQQLTLSKPSASPGGLVRVRTIKFIQGMNWKFDKSNKCDPTFLPGHIYLSEWWKKVRRGAPGGHERESE